MAHCAFENLAGVLRIRLLFHPNDKSKHDKIEDSRKWRTMIESRSFWKAGWKRFFRDWYFVGNRQRSVWSGVAIAGSLFRHLLHSLSLFLFYLLRSLSSTVSLTLFFPPLLPFLSSLSQTRSTAPSFFIYVIARHSRDRRDALAITFICFICARNGARETNLAEKEREREIITLGYQVCTYDSTKKKNSSV